MMMRYCSRKTQTEEFDDFIVSTYAAICLIENPWAPLTADQLNIRFADSDDFIFDSTLQTELAHGIVTSSDVETLDNLLGMADCVESLLEARFGVSGNQLNVPAIRQRLGKNPLSVLDDLAKTRIDNIDWRVRFSNDDETQLRTLGQTAYDTYSTLVDIESQTSIDSDAEQILARLNGVTADGVGEIHSTFETSYNDIAPAEFLEALDSLVEYEDENFEEVRKGANVVSGTQYGLTAQVRQALGLVKLRANPIVSLMDDLFDESQTTTERIAPKFKEVANYYVGE